jgi:hypothetical protein
VKKTQKVLGNGVIEYNVMYHFEINYPAQTSIMFYRKDAVNYFWRSNSKVNDKFSNKIKFNITLPEPRHQIITIPHSSTDIFPNFVRSMTAVVSSPAFSP